MSRLPWNFFLCQIPFLKSKLALELHDHKKHYKLINHWICLQLCKFKNRQPVQDFFVLIFSFSFSIYCQTWAFELRSQLHYACHWLEPGKGQWQLPVPNNTASLPTSACKNPLQRSYCFLSVWYNMSSDVPTWPTLLSEGLNAALITEGYTTASKAPVQWFALCIIRNLVFSPVPVLLQWEEQSAHCKWRAKSLCGGA